MSYATKKAAVRAAHVQVKEGLKRLDPVLIYDVSKVNTKGYGIVKLWDEIGESYVPEGLVNIYFEDDIVKYSVVNVPGSDIPFDDQRGQLDYDRDGVIEADDIAAIAVELWNKIND